MSDNNFVDPVKLSLQREAAMRQSLRLDSELQELGIKPRERFGDRVEIKRMDDMITLSMDALSEAEREEAVAMYMGAGYRSARPVEGSREFFEENFLCSFPARLQELPSDRTGVRVRDALFAAMYGSRRAQDPTRRNSTNASSGSACAGEEEDDS